MKFRPDEENPKKTMADQHFAHMVRRLLDPVEREKARRKNEREARAKEKISDTGL